MISPQQADVIVIGAGAAGFMCAAEAGKRGRRVLLLERAGRPGKKILISGGGRCNFTNLECRPENYLSSNPHFHKSALARYTPADFIRLVERHRIPYHEKTLGQLFCDRSSEDIVNLLTEECRLGNVGLILNCQIESIHRGDQFVLQTNEGSFSAPALVIATGGLSIPKLGATSFGYDAAHRFGLRLVPCRPALVPLTFHERDRANYADLAGISAEAAAAFASQRFREKLLITHRGLSGPVVLQISSYWDGASPIMIDLLPGRDFSREVEARRAEGDKRPVRSILADFVPKRLADRWIDLSNGSLHPGALDEALHRWMIAPSGTEGFSKAEVTAGGVHPDELSSKTMESRNVPGLFFIGEVVDVTGHLGGYNFQWAWSSGWVAGQSV